MGSVVYRQLDEIEVSLHSETVLRTCAKVEGRAAPEEQRGLPLGSAADELHALHQRRGVQH